MISRFVNCAGGIYRVLLETADGAWLIAYAQTKPPFFISAANLTAYTAIPAPEGFVRAINAHESMSEAQVRRLQMIEPLVADDQYICDSKARRRKAQEIADANGVTVRTVLRLYFRYISSGVILENKPRERRRNPDFERAIQRYYYSSRQFSLRAAYEMMILEHYMDSLSALRSSSASAIATQVKILCMTHHVGLIIVDEIQNAVVTARKNRQVKPLIKFLVELTNDTSTAVYFIGTPLAEELFIAQEHLKRRTRGIRLLPLRPDGTYREFLQSIWPYQYTPQSAALTDKLANKLYDFSGGIPAYIIKIFQESQAQALILCRSSIDEKIMQRAIDILAIKVPKTYSGGTHISDFEIGKELPEVPPEPQEVPRQYANKRGRRATQRDDADLLVAFRESRGAQEMIKFLEIHNMLERMGNE